MLRPSLFALAAVAALVACSSDDPPADVPDAGGGGAPDGGGGTGSEASTRKDAATDGPVGPTVECSVGGAVEVEPDDTAESATPFTELTFCGVLSSGTDVDYSTFATPAGTKLGIFQAVVDGKVDFELALNGQKFGPQETSRFGSGTYVVKVSTSAGQPASYNYRVQFDPN